MKQTISACAVCALLYQSLALAQGQNIHIEPPPKGDRIQLRQWTLTGETFEDGSPVTDPFTQIVMVQGGGRHGTGFFLENCRVMTVLHVLIGIKRGSDDPDSVHLNPGETLVGETFDFETQPIPWRNGRKATGRFIVIGHGTGRSKRSTETKLSIASQNADWAIGYDSECLSETLNLGTFRFDSFYDHLAKGRTMVTAGYPGITVSGMPSGEYPLYVDSRCTILKWLDWSQTNCSAWHGMSGAPLLLGPLRLGGTLLTAKGRLIFTAVGIFQIGYNEPAAPGQSTVPNFPSLWTGAALFNSSMEKQITPYVTGPVDVAALKKR